MESRNRRLPVIGNSQYSYYLKNNYQHQKKLNSVDNKKPYNRSNYNFYDSNKNSFYKPNAATANNFLKISYTNKDEINSFQNNISTTYYNRNKPFSYFFDSDKKKTPSISSSLYDVKKTPYKSSYENSFNSFLKSSQPHNRNFLDNNTNNIYNIKSNSKNYSLNKDRKTNFNTAHNTLTTSKINSNNNNNNLTQKNISINLTTSNFRNKSQKPYSFQKVSPNNNNFNKTRQASESTSITISHNAKKRKCPLCNKELDKNRINFHINNHPSKIFDWLFLGCYRNACNKEEIKDLKINYVLNCAFECMESFNNSVKYCHLKLSDMPSFRIIPFFERATNFINQAHKSGGIILVHCQLGISRSTSCVIAYMIKYMGFTTMSALEFIRKKRPQVMPNYGFLQQLMTYEKSNLGKGMTSDVEKNNN